MGSIRRRQLMESGGDYIENPNYVYMELITTQENEQITIGYVLPSLVDVIIIDGEQKSPSTYNSGGSFKITFGVPGKHSVAYHLYKKISSNYHGYIFHHSLEYYRLPYNISTTAEGALGSGKSYGESFTCKQLDILDPNYNPTMFSGAHKLSSFEINLIRVPMGTKANWQGIVSESIYNKIQEYNFKYKTT